MLLTRTLWPPALAMLAFMHLLYSVDDAYQLLTQASQEEAAGKWDAALKKLDAAARLEPKLPEIYSQRGGVHFKLGHIRESLADFDMQIKLRPKDGPAHWRRGLTLYYAEKYPEGVAQFTSSDKAEPEDVENAVWHLLCNAKVVGLDTARKQLLKVRQDRRVPMMDVYALFAGTLSPEKVLQQAEAGNPDEKESKQRHFYAHLYVGLYYEMIQQPEKSLAHIEKAVRDYPISHYMMDVARVHVQLRKKNK